MQEEWLIDGGKMKDEWKKERWWKLSEPELVVVEEAKSFEEGGA